MKFLSVALLAISTMTISAAGPVPSSARSKAAAERLKPKLTAELAKQNLRLGDPVFIRIFKEPAILQLWIRRGGAYQQFKMYQICKYSGTLGPKLKEGDHQAPEGIYSVGPGQMNPNSRFHLSFNLGYPNAFDKSHGRTGSALMVHGSCVSIGCYAMGDEAIEEIWTICAAALEGGQTLFPVHIFPFPLTQNKLKRESQSPWISFWQKLQPIYEAFEKTRVPPIVTVKDRRYVIRGS